MENNPAPVEVGSLSQGLYIPWNDDDLRTRFPSHLMELFQKITFFAKENSLDFILYIHQVAIQQVLFFPLNRHHQPHNVSWNILEWSSYKSHGIFIFRFHDWIPIPRGFFQSWLIPTPHRIHVSDVYYVHLPTFAWLILASFCWFGNYPSGNDHISRKEPTLSRGRRDQHLEGFWQSKTEIKPTRVHEIWHRDPNFMHFFWWNRNPGNLPSRF